jgi:hypothetical protein
MASGSTSQAITRARAQQAGGRGENAGAGADVEHGDARLDQFLQRFEAQARGFVNASAEGEARVHGNAETAGRGGIVAPLRNQKEAAADFHRLQHVARLLHPIAILLFARAGAGVARQQRGAIGAGLRRTRARASRSAR